MKITVTLNDFAAKYFAEVHYSLESPKGGSPTKSDVINHCLQELSLFEKFTDDQLSNWLQTNYPDKYAEFLQTITTTP